MLIILMFSLTLFSCGIQTRFFIKYVKSQEELGIKQPLIRFYHLSQSKFEYSNLVDTNMAYIQYVETHQKSLNTEVMVNYIRFSGEGLCFVSNFYPKNHIENISHISGQYCFYSILDSNITIEMYNHRLKTFELRQGIINEKGIMFFKYKGRPWGTWSTDVNYWFEKGNLTKVQKPIKFPD